MATFADVLRAVMEERNVKEKDLPMLTGLPQPTINRYLTGQRDPTWLNVVRIADALGVPLDAFRGTLPTITKGLTGEGQDSDG